MKRDADGTELRVGGSRAGLFHDDQFAPRRRATQSAMHYLT